MLLHVLVPSRILRRELKLTFTEWIAFIFDHPVTDPEWHWDINVDWPELDESRLVSYLTLAFDCADIVFQPFSDAQLNQGLNLLVSCSCSDTMHALRNEAVSLDERLACIHAMESLFRKCFAARCSPHLSHLDEPGVNPLNSVCYMWWDVIPIHGLSYHMPHRSDSASIDKACLAVMKGILEIDSVACQESALHGLAHWSPYYPEIKQTVDEFLRQHRNLRRELGRYAQRCRVGAVA